MGKNEYRLTISFLKSNQKISLRLGVGFLPPFSRFTKYARFKVSCLTRHSKLNEIWTEDHSTMLVALRKKFAPGVRLSG